MADIFGEENAISFTKLKNAILDNSSDLALKIGREGREDLCEKLYSMLGEHVSKEEIRSALSKIGEERGRASGEERDELDKELRLLEQVIK